MAPISSAAAALRPATNLVNSQSIRTMLHARSYATQNSLGTTASQTTRRRTVTPFNDDGHVPWNELSAAEKTARATQQSFNFGMIIAGLVLTGGVTYFLWTDVFSPDSKTALFNRAVDKIKKDPRCLELLGDAKKITAHGDETFNKWRRARPLAATERVDPQGNHHLLMHFFVDGPANNGVAHLHMIKYRGQDDYEYKYLFVDVKGHPKIYLENADSSQSGSGKDGFRLFGVKWK
ncbi:Mitochondrial import inner membrane translocase subunit TIM21 [Paramyrothecium foliicola]|nr:Mitochondrial import inner membrane translocase subunit TIM21 [Paramyrothecium foliicola]